MKVERYRDLHEWEEFAAREYASLAGEAQFLQELKLQMPVSGMPGHCPVCEAPRNFMPPQEGMRPDTSFRESLQCDTCCSISRHRAAIAVLQQDLPDAQHARIYITEQASMLFMALRKRLRRLAGSEFVRSFRKRRELSAWMRSQGCRSFVRFQDITALSFRRGSKQAVVSFDVLEHVPDYRQALREFARVLKPGGVLVMTVPFYAASADSETIAFIRADGGVETFGDPEYHGDPVSHGVLCFHHLGWDLLAAMREAGFAEAEALRVSDLKQGIPEPLWLFRARR
jgi:SAM-dependent methyltransferase